MRSTLILCGILGMAVSASAKEPRAYQAGTLLQMDAVPCSKTQAGLCQEYSLQSERVIYHIRPRDEKHTELLPVGSLAQFRLEKGRMLLLVQGNNKERGYVVVSVTPRTEASSADATTMRVNHLQ